MDLLHIIKKKKEKKDFFLALIFKPSKIAAILFEEVEGKLLILSTKEEKINVSINELNEEEIIDTCDIVISFIENSLPQNEFVTKTIFGLPYDWSDNGKIKRENLSKLKKLCEELELTPLGFILSAEAAINFLQKKEGAPLSVIFIEILDGTIAVYLVRAGKIVQVQSGPLKEGYAASVEDILKQMGAGEALPSKIILLDYEDSHNIQQEFLSYQWMTNLSFLHLPQVEVFESEFENESIINGVATQMGFDIFDETTNTENQKENQEDETNESYEDFGFLQDEDITEKEEEPILQTNSNFILKHAVKEDATGVNPGRFIPREEDDLSEVLEKEKGKKESKFTSVSLIRQKLGIFSILSKIKPSNYFKFSSNLKIILFLIISLGLIGTFVFAYYNFILKANVSISLAKKTFKKEQQVSLLQDSSTSTKDSIIKVTSVDDQEEGEKTIPTTGKKETGDKATGEVIVYNKTDQPVSLPKGTILIGTNSLEFELVNDSSIASTDPFSTTLSSLKTQVQAESYGPEYNLPSNTNFSFKDYATSSYFAKNDNPFSGGTKKTIQTVAQSDIDNLANTLSSSLGDKAIDSMKGKISSDDVLLPFLISSDFIDKKYDKKVGDEGQTVRLYAKMKFSSGYYAKSDLDKFEKDLAGDSIPSNFYKEISSSKSELNNIKINKDNKMSANLSIDSVYLPRFDLAKLKIDIKGKNKSFYDPKIKEIDGVSDYSVEFKNKISFLPELMPYNLNNIQISVKGNE